MNNKVYLVIGTVWGEDTGDTLTVVNDYAVHSTKKGAREELYRVLDETVKEAKKHRITFKSNMEEDKLKIEWVETGAVELWKILEREIDKEVKEND
jgi:sugar phosphate isomerase/epimerase